MSDLDRFLIFLGTVALFVVLPCIYNEAEASEGSAGNYNPQNSLKENTELLTVQTKDERAKAVPAWVTELKKKNPFLDEFRAAADEYHVPLFLLLAICDHESGRNPWALNIAGKSFLPDTREKALTILREQYKPSFDVGLMQVNSYWIRKLKLRVQDVFEPKINIHIAAYILDECFRSYGKDWKALGAYHHPPDKDSARSLRYSKAVWSRFLRYEKNSENNFLQ